MRACSGDAARSPGGVACGAVPRSLAGACLSVTLAACAPDASGGEYALYQHLELAQEVVIGAGEGWASEAAALMVPRLETELGLPVFVRDPARARGGARRVRMLLGYPDTPELQPALERLGIERDGSPRIRIGQWAFGGEAGGALVATLADPAHGDAPLTIFVALESRDPVGWAHADLDIVRELRPTWRTGWQVWDGTGRLLAQGQLDGDGRAVAGDEPRPAEPPSRIAEVLAARGDLADLQADLSAARARVLEVLGPSPTLEGFEPFLRVHSHPEDLALGARTWRSWRCAPASGVVDLVVAPGLFVDARAAFAELYARRTAREPREAWLVDGLARHVARTWWGRDLDEWCAHLERAGLVPRIEELVSPAPRASPHQVGPLRALLLEVLLGTRGVEHLRQLWREGGLVIDGELREAFRSRLEVLAAAHGPRLESRRTGRRAQVLARPLRKGVAVVPVRERVDRIASGLGGRGCAASLERIAALGADAVSFELAGWIQRPWGHSALEPRSGPAAQVADLELATACAAARERGLDVLVQPSLWMAPGSILASHALVRTAAEYGLFFEEYRLFLLHQALLAELTDVEVLSLGSEMGSAVVTQRRHGDWRWDDDHFEWKRSRWLDLTAEVRAAFGGGLTYGLRWDEQPELVSFWDRLDFVGVHLFTPLVERGEQGRPPRLEELSGQLWAALTRAEARAAALGKRLLVLEIGHPSARDAWSRPDLPSGPADERAQGLFLTALSIQLRARGQASEGLAGLYVWCWSADPERDVAWARGYTIQDKSGERALERAFREP